MNVPNPGGVRSVEPNYDAAALWDIAIPSGPRRMPGVKMAGFRSRAPAPVALRALPYPAVTVGFNLGDGLLTVTDASGSPQTGSVVAGLAPDGVWLRAEGIECLQVRLSPVVAHAVLGASSELGGTVASLDEVWGRDLGRVLEQLRGAGSWQDRFAVAEAVLGRRWEEGQRVDPEVAFVWSQMVASRGQARVDRLAAGVGWSRKWLWSRFRSQVGLSPKRVAQLVRFDHAAHRLAAGHSAALVAGDSGYVDQSHLHRDVMAFAGVTPAAVAAAPWLAVDPVAWAPQRGPQRPGARGREPGTGHEGTFLQDARQVRSLVSGCGVGDGSKGMQARLVLVHSPLVGCRIWEPVADLLASDGYVVTVPDMAGAVSAGPPYQLCQAQMIADCAAGRPVILIGYSRAGPLLATAGTMLGGEIRGYVFVDARLPSPGRPWMETIRPGLAARLRDMADPQGWLPPWPQWWGEEELAALVPDPSVRQRFAAGCPRLPVAMLEEGYLPAPGWPNAPGGYLQLSQAYEDDAARAREYGWPVRQQLSHHLALLTEPGQIARGIRELIGLL